LHAGVISLLWRTGVHTARCTWPTNICARISDFIFVFFVVVVFLLLTSQASARFWTAAWLWAFDRY
jgi:hypothetical protein